MRTSCDHDPLVLILRTNSIKSRVAQLARLLSLASETLYMSVMQLQSEIFAAAAVAFSLFQLARYSFRAELARVRLLAHAQRSSCLLAIGFVEARSRCEMLAAASFGRNKRLG